MITIYKYCDRGNPLLNGTRMNSTPRHGSLKFMCPKTQFWEKYVEILVLMKTLFTNMIHFMMFVLRQDTCVINSFWIRRTNIFLSKCQRSDHLITFCFVSTFCFKLIFGWDIDFCQTWYCLRWKKRPKTCLTNREKILIMSLI